MYSSLNIIAVLLPKILSSSLTVSVFLTKDSFIICWAIAYLLMSLLPMYKKLTVSDSTDIVIDIAAEILFNVNMLCACERFKFFG